MSSHRWPHVLPENKGALFIAYLPLIGEGGIRAIPASGGKARVLAENSTGARYLSDGHLVYLQRGGLFSAPMNAAKLELTGPAVPLLDDSATPRICMTSAKTE